ncbi:hypothetical protein [Actinomycetospora chiangmaiensis]|uniref:hypothetical protein n=1 Tax=Actinomycetospora chiangmaiensis TaxID=402650 RepID=UPI0003693964|nr:hypothetical protein [Actinomycetospora chiangmaiensis]
MSGRDWARRVLLATVVLVLAGLGFAGVASAQDAPPTPQPYGGQLGKMDPGDQVTSEQVLEVGMLTLGTVNGLAFVIAMVASRLRGPTTAQTRRALINRTGAGTVSESRRARRARAAARTRAAAPAVVPGHGPVPMPPHAPAGAVPPQGGPVGPVGRGAHAASEGLVPAARGAASPPRPAAPRPAPASPPAGVRSPVRR